MKVLRADAAKAVVGATGLEHFALEKEAAHQKAEADAAAGKAADAAANTHAAPKNQQ